ncbi:protein preli-like [Anthonomus grandis grandis]|uniref:protein preli-like n=1 Tax=Anthonomus grandis grandis TaxID=2921223 RepID=UPI002165AA1F|nr:protein preli-like [Anthonomus grandis grandis]
MRFFENSTVFNYSWEQVAQGFWKRYPNPNSTHVLSEDTITREVRSGKLVTKRLLSKTNSIPSWAKKFINTSHVYIVEESIIDTKSKTLVTYTRNIGFTKAMTVTEKVIYKQCEENPLKTVAIRYAWIDSQVRGFSRAICAFGYERFKKNAHKMVSGFNFVLQNMFPHQHVIPNAHVAATAANKLKDAAKSASELAKSKAAPIYASLHPNQS